MTTSPSSVRLDRNPSLFCWDLPGPNFSENCPWFFGTCIDNRPPIYTVLLLDNYPPQRQKSHVEQIPWNLLSPCGLNPKILISCYWMIHSDNFSMNRGSVQKDSWDSWKLTISFHVMSHPPVLGSVGPNPKSNLDPSHPETSSCSTEQSQEIQLN